MKFPNEVAVMTLPNVTLFPQALLPLYIFEPRYRRMLAETLASHRMFAVAMNRSVAGRESPVPVAGLGLVRVSVQHQDGTSHLILQGLARVALGKATRHRPYRVHQVRPMEASPGPGEVEEVLLAEVRQLLGARLRCGVPLPVPFLPQCQDTFLPPNSAKEMFAYLSSIADPEKAADLVSSAVLSSPRDRQKILETADVRTRLHWLIQFLQRDLRRSKKKSHE